MSKVRYALAAAALTATVSPLAAQPAQAMACAEGFEVICFAIGTACLTLQAVEVPDKIHFSCELGR